jgi:hypothetical protein
MKNWGSTAFGGIFPQMSPISPMTHLQKGESTAKRAKSAEFFNEFVNNNAYSLRFR